MRKKAKKLRVGPTPAIRQIRREIAAVDLLCSGTLLKRWKQCGRPNCRCAHDPSARHGPYYEWSRRRNDRLLHSLLSAEQAEDMALAIKNYHRILRLLAAWSHETARALGVSERSK
jgi:hypothetical protein